MRCHESVRRDSHNLHKGCARKGLMLGVLALIAAGAVVVAEPALSAGPVMSPSVGAPPPKAPSPAPGAVSPGPVSPGAGTPTVGAPQVPLGASALPTTTAPKGFPTGGGVPTAINPIPGVDVIVRKNPHGIAMKLRTDGTGSFTLGELTPGEYVIELPGNSLRSAIDKLDAKQLPGGTGTGGNPSVSVALLLPAIQKVREAGSIRTNTPIIEKDYARIEHTFTGTTTGGTPHIQFTVAVVAVGTDTTPTAAVGGFTATIDWGDGSPSMIFDRWGNLFTDLPSSPGVNAAVAPNNPTDGTTGPEFKKRKHNYKGTVTLIR
jgi:hypothetical protein